MGNMYSIGIDLGSTTAKIAVFDEDKKMVYSDYVRHKADVRRTLIGLLRKVEGEFADTVFDFVVTGSAGLGLHERIGIPFVQELIAVSDFVKYTNQKVKSIIDIGGEDSKLIFFDRGKMPLMRMNGNCAGGTGAFIDQMAVVLGVEVGELDSLAAGAEHVYPIASRCGVFSKTDVQNLIAKGAAKQDIAVSVFNAVALQVVSSLSKGLQIKPPILFCGGPLTYISSLREAFVKLLHISAKDVVCLDCSNLIPAMGSVYSGKGEGFCLTAGELIGKLEALEDFKDNDRGNRLEPVFENEQEYSRWLSEKRRMEKRRDLKGFEGGCFLGIDSGSTTTKVVVSDMEDNILFFDYSKNGGNSLEATVAALERFDKACEQSGARPDVLAACSTGYGEDLIRAAFSLDYSIVETIAHYKAAKVFCPEVDFILDIGGQDMKALYIEDGVLNRIEINEACSSGCGSFIETFANTLSYSVADFARLACFAKEPCDLGTRCTVFMNSKVKQFLREGATVADISAGLSYSVVRNCLYKVLKLNSLAIGRNIVVQGGTMKNDSIVKAFENMLSVKVFRSSNPELMGAYGCALYAKEKYLKERKKTAFNGHVSGYTTKEINCRGCENNCMVTKYVFDNSMTYHSGNKCEKVFTSRSKSEKGSNIYDYKIERVFAQEKVEDAVTELGVPRVLNMFEDFPFWQSLFSCFGIRLVLSDLSTYEQYEGGLSQVISENICFPAKLVHAHVNNLVEKGLNRIFFPYVVYEKQDDATAANSYNCPIVSSYNTVIKNQLLVYGNDDVKVDNPVFTFKDKRLFVKSFKRYIRQLASEYGHMDCSDDFVERAVEKAARAQMDYERDVRDKAKEYLDTALGENRMVILLAARPYHTDALIQHKLSTIISDLGVTVISDDLLRGDRTMEMQDTYMISQWAYMNRIVKSAKWVGEQNDTVNYVQLTSFGCGPDAFLLDEVSNILKRYNKVCTVIKVDDINNVGSMRLRIRSLIESLKLKKSLDTRVKDFVNTKLFDRQDRERTILAPFFTDYASPFLPEIFEISGYKLEVLPKSDAVSADLGLKYSNNEVCYPATLIVGDMIKALQSGRYDLNTVAVGITQTGGQCRASSYYPIIRKALVDAGFSQVPVVSVTMGTDISNNQPGFRMNWFKVLPIAFSALLFGDCLSKMYHSTVVRVRDKAKAEDLRNSYISRAKQMVLKRNRKAVFSLLKEAVNSFNSLLPKEYVPLKKVGIVGEIFLKFHSFANKDVVSWLISQNMEVLPPTLTSFFTQSFVNRKAKEEYNLDSSKVPDFVFDGLYFFVKKEIERFNNVLSGFRYYSPLEDVFQLADDVKHILPLVTQFGEGWLLPAEIVSYAKQKADAVISLQPFGCIANHIISKGVENRIKQIYPDVELLSLDFDSGVSEVNIVNRLMLLKDSICK